MIYLAKIPEMLQQKYDSWYSLRSTYLTQHNEAKDIYDQNVEATETQFKKSQVAKILKTLGFKINHNKIFPIVQQTLAILTRRKPSHKLTAIDSKYDFAAEFLDQLRYSLMNSSKANVINELATEDMLIGGIGLTGMERTLHYRKNEFGCRYKYYSAENVLLDANCTDPTLEKMEGWFYESELTLAEAQKYYGWIIDLINKFGLNEKLGIPNNITMDFFKSSQTGGMRSSPENLLYGEVVRIREFYDKKFTKAYYVPDPVKVISVIFEENLYEDQKARLADAFETEEDIFQRRTLILGDYVVFVEMMESRNYGIFPRMYKWSGKPYKSRGVVHYIKDMNYLYQLTMIIMIINGLMSSTAGFEAPAGALNSPTMRDAYSKNLLDPLTLKIYNPQIFGDSIVLKPERIKIEPLSNFFPLLLEAIQKDLWDIPGMNPILMGNPTDSKVEVFSALQKYESAAMQRILLQLDHINNTEETIGLTAVDYILESLQPEQSFWFFDQEGNNISQNVVTPEMLMNLRKTRYALIAQPGEAYPSKRLAAADSMFKIAQSAGDPVERSVLTTEAMRNSGIHGMGEISQKLDIANRLKEQVQGLSQQIERISQINEQLSNEIIQARQNEIIYRKISQIYEKLGKAEGVAESELEITNLKKQIKEKANEKNTTTTN